MIKIKYLPIMMFTYSLFAAGSDHDCANLSPDLNIQKVCEQAK
ncbi:MAG: hypothetical protein MEPRV_02118 [Providencia sp.]